ncbi:hypothetical protein H0H93_009263 [Arthromyces matolae]|nr:hypothetical protein H0H93_009263 [Arthromyces matolae]
MFILPTEVFSLILDELLDDTRALSRISLLSHRAVEPAQQRIFNSIVLYDQPVAERLAWALESNPVLRSYVHTLTWSPKVLFKCESLPNLRTLSIKPNPESDDDENEWIDWNTLPKSATISTLLNLATSPRLTNLFVQFLDNFPLYMLDATHIQCLSLDTCGLWIDTPPNSHPSDKFHRILGDSCITQLSLIYSVVDGYDLNPACWARLVSDRCIYPSVEEMTLSLNTYFRSNTLIGYNLTGMGNLRRLTLWSICPPSSILDHIITILRTLPNDNRLEYVCISINYDCGKTEDLVDSCAEMNVTRMDWKKIESLLASFIYLKEVRVHTRHNDSCGEDIPKDFSDEKMTPAPRLLAEECNVMERLVNTFKRNQSSSTAQGTSKTAVEASVQAQKYKFALDGFAESTKVALDILTALGEIHPFIKGPVVAFKVVLTLDLKRRENEAKVQAMKVEMQSMMAVFLQLQDHPDPQAFQADAGLQSLMKDVEEEIRNAFAFCDYYMNKSLMRRCRCLKSSIYEIRFADYAQRFYDLGVQLHRQLSIHMIWGIYGIQKSCDELNTQMEEVKSQLKYLFTLLETDREKELLSFIERSGGARACVEDDGSLHELMTQESTSSRAPSLLLGLPTLPSQDPLDISLETNGDDGWTLQYIHVSFLQPIAEAIDDDGSSFITIREINDFITMRPQSYSTLQWLAYWAAGWHSSVSQYVDKIYRLLRKFHRLREEVRLENLVIYDDYLHHPAFTRLHHLLRSTRKATVAIHPQLAKLRNEFTKAEEDRLFENLKKLSFTLDSSATVKLVTGPYRIKRMNLAPKSHFEHYAFGMFHSSFNGPMWRERDDTTHKAWASLPIEAGENDDVETCPKDISVDILQYTPADPFELDRSLVSADLVNLDCNSSTISGSWSVQLYDEKDDYGGHFLIDLKAPQSGRDQGTGTSTGYTWFDNLEVTYFVIATEADKNDVDIRVLYPSRSGVRLIGAFSTTASSISGESYSYKEEPPSTISSGSGNLHPNIDDRDGLFRLSRTPGSLLSFRYLWTALAQSPVKARWNFVRQAILFGVRRDRMDKNYVKGVLKDCRRFVEVSMQSWMEMTAIEKLGLMELGFRLSPSVASFFHGIAVFLCDRLQRHQ